MKLNIDCIRAVLLEAENIPYGKMLGSKALYSSLKAFNKEDIDYSVLILEENNYINAVVAQSDDGVIRKFVIHDITGDGRKFLDNIRIPSSFEKVKEKCGAMISHLPDIVGIASTIISSID